jgi:hypothetical protein
MGKSQSRKNRHEERAPQLSMASREIVTRYQLDSLMQVLGMSSSALAHFLRVDPNTDKLTACETEARISIENTVRSACERMDTILREESRWSMDFQIEAEKKFSEAQVLNNQLLQKQRDAAEEITSPHFRYRPTMLRLVDGSWCAFLGNIDFMEQGVVGVGESPAEAIAAFDDVWHGVTNEKVLAWAKQREKHLETGIPLGPFPIDQNEQLDKITNQRPESASSEGPDSNSDSGAAGPQSEIR